MDKNQIIGMVLIFALLIGYGMYTAPSKEEQLAMQRERDSIQNVLREQHIKDSLKRIQDSIATVQNKLVQNENDTLVVDSSKIANLEKEYGAFASAVAGKEEFVTIENEKVKIKFTT
ncbi:MAG: hypothetical protein GXO49_07585, partial [Chlorobi bacterium]|nr:hypothetical protein [Chlorobiota bacterium]